MGLLDLNDTCREGGESRRSEATLSVGASQYRYKSAISGRERRQTTGHRMRGQLKFGGQGRRQTTRHEKRTDCATEEFC